MRVLVTGGHGFAGRHLAEHLVRCGDDVAVSYIGRDIPNDPLRKKIDARCPLPRSVQSMQLDVTNESEVSEFIGLLKPDIIYHLAGIAFVPTGDCEFDTVYRTNTLGTFNILRAIKERSSESRLLFISSSQIYGEGRPGALPHTETSELRPVSTYGLTKACADLAVYKYAAHDGIHAVRVRPFPHVGPGQSEEFSLSNFCKQAAMIKLGRAEPIMRVGNLEVKRDFCDVSDIVRGYHEAAMNGKPGDVYNLCSGESVLMSDLVKMIIKLSGVEIEIQEESSRVRPVDIQDHVGSYQKAQRELGWKPRVEREAMLDGLISFWLDVLQ